MKKYKQIVAPQRLTLVKELGSERMNEFEGSIDHCINILQNLKDKGCTHVEFHFSEGDNCYCSDHRLEFFQTYVESDSEYKERIEEIKKYEKAKRERTVQQRIKQKEDRKKLYEQLKKEFEKTSNTIPPEFPPNTFIPQFYF